jgi:hypothetical protein
MRNDPVQSSWMNDQAGRTALFPDSTSRQPDRAGTDETIKKERNGGTGGAICVRPVYLIELMFRIYYTRFQGFVKIF